MSFLRFSSAATSSDLYPYSAIPTNSAENSGETASGARAITTGAKSGIAIGAVALFAALCILVFLLRRKKINQDKGEESHDKSRELNLVSAQPAQSKLRDEKVPTTFEEIFREKKDGSSLGKYSFKEKNTETNSFRDDGSTTKHFSEHPVGKEEGSRVVSELPATAPNEKHPLQVAEPPQAYIPYRLPPTELSSTPGPEKQQQRIANGRALHQGVPQHSKRPKEIGERIEEGKIEASNGNGCEELDSSTALHEAPS